MDEKEKRAEVAIYIRISREMARAHLEIVDVAPGSYEVELRVRGTSRQEWLFNWEAEAVITEVLDSHRSSESGLSANDVARMVDRAVERIVGEANDGH
jgi:hypothetical protein